MDRRDLRQRVIALIENGWRYHVPLRTAHKWAHKFQNYGEFQRHYSTGRPLCLTREEDEAVCSVHEENSFCSVNQIRAAANFPWHFSDSYESFERCKYSLPDSCVQRGLSRGTSCRNRLEGFRLGKRNILRWNIHLFQLWITWTCLSWARHQLCHSLYPMTWEVGTI